MQRSLTRLAVTLAAGLALGAAFGVSAQGFPNKPIRLVVPFAAGGSTDTVARLVAERLGREIGQPVIVDNRPGAGGTLGTALVAQAPADGYTLLLGSSGSVSIGPSLYRNLPYGPDRLLAPVSLIAETPVVVVVNPSLPVAGLAELIALARKSPGKLNFGSPGSGSLPHLYGELFRHKAGIDMVHVPYKGNAPAVADLLGGQIPLMFSDASVVPQVKAGKLRALAVTADRRLSALPEVPNVAELGMKGYEGGSWYGILAPHGTPADIVIALDSRIRRIVQTPEVQTRLRNEGAEPIGEGPARFAEVLAQDAARWSQVIRESSIRID